MVQCIQSPAIPAQAMQGGGQHQNLDPNRHPIHAITESTDSRQPSQDGRPGVRPRHVRSNSDSASMLRSSTFRPLQKGALHGHPPLRGRDPWLVDRAKEDDQKDHDPVAAGQLRSDGTRRSR